MGVLIRHWFNTRHAGTGNPHWTWGATAVIFVAIMWLSSPPMGRDQPAEAALPEALRPVAASPGFDEVANIVLGRCSMCHTAEPVWPGLHWAPRGVHLDTEAAIARNARAIYLQAGASHAMPPGNVTFMPPEERAILADWYRGLETGPGPLAALVPR
jgi:uncharacterized membrane protein